MISPVATTHSVFTMPSLTPKQLLRHVECVSTGIISQGCPSPGISIREMPNLPTLEQLLQQATTTHHSDTLAAEARIEVLRMFTQYLSRMHCLESLEFSLAMMEFILDPNRESWDAIYHTFIEEDSPRELNVPASIKNALTRGLKRGFPEMDALVACQRHVYDDILINLYHEFIKEAKASLVGPDNVLFHRKQVYAGVEYDVGMANRLCSDDDDDDESLSEDDRTKSAKRRYLRRRPNFSASFAERGTEMRLSDSKSRDIRTSVQSEDEEWANGFQCWSSIVNTIRKLTFRSKQRDKRLNSSSSWHDGSERRYSVN